MLMNNVFPNDFYYKYHAPNADQFINNLNKYTEKDIDNYPFQWGEECSVDRVPLKWEDYIDLLTPSIDLLSDEIGSSFKYTIQNPWLNFYNRGSYQETHDHSNHDIACVFFVNNGENFSYLYFQDRNSNAITPLLKPLLKHTNMYIPDIEAGDILFFPAHMLHGVTQQKSDVVRKSFAANLNISPETYNSLDYKNGKMVLTK